MTDELLTKIVDQLFGVHIALSLIAGLLAYIAVYITMTLRKHQ